MTDTTLIDPHSWSLLSHENNWQKARKQTIKTITYCAMHYGQRKLWKRNNSGGCFLENVAREGLSQKKPLEMDWGKKESSVIGAYRPFWTDKVTYAKALGGKNLHSRNWKEWSRCEVRGRHAGQRRVYSHSSLLVVSLPHPWGWHKGVGSIYFWMGSLQMRLGQGPAICFLWYIKGWSYISRKSSHMAEGDDVAGANGQVNEPKAQLTRDPEGISCSSMPQ